MVIATSISVVFIITLLTATKGIDTLVSYGSAKVEILQNQRLACEFLREDFQGLRLGSIGEGRMGGYKGIWGKTEEQLVIGYYLNHNNGNLYRYVASPLEKARVRDNEFPSTHPHRFNQPTSNPLVQGVANFSYILPRGKMAVMIYLEMGKGSLKVPLELKIYPRN